MAGEISALRSVALRARGLSPKPRPPYQDTHSHTGAVFCARPFYLRESFFYWPFTSRTMARRRQTRGWLARDSRFQVASHDKRRNSRTSRRSDRRRRVSADVWKRRAAIQGPLSTHTYAHIRTHEIASISRAAIGLRAAVDRRANVNYGLHHRYRPVGV